jgi:hypothetical protein
MHRDRVIRRSRSSQQGGLSAATGWVHARSSAMRRKLSRPVSRCGCRGCGGGSNVKECWMPGLLRRAIPEAMRRCAFQQRSGVEPAVGPDTQRRPARSAATANSTLALRPLSPPMGFSTHTWSAGSQRFPTASGACVSGGVSNMDDRRGWWPPFSSPKLGNSAPIPKRSARKRAPWPRSRSGRLPTTCAPGYRSDGREGGSREMTPAPTICPLSCRSPLLFQQLAARVRGFRTVGPPLEALFEDRSEDCFQSQSRAGAARTLASQVTQPVGKPGCQVGVRQASGSTRCANCSGLSGSDPGRPATPSVNDSREVPRFGDATTGTPSSKGLQPRPNPNGSGCTRGKSRRHAVNNRRWAATSTS